MKNYFSCNTEYYISIIERKEAPFSIEHNWIFESNGTLLQFILYSQYPPNNVSSIVSLAQFYVNKLMLHNLVEEGRIPRVCGRSDFGMIKLILQ